MRDTKENILLTSLSLFAQSGYDAVSVSDIAGRLGMTKGALYRHYRNKRAIFDAIVARMERLDAERALQYELPTEVLSPTAEQAYRDADVGQILRFSQAQFHYWTQEEFPAAFRKMLTLEQFRSEEMSRLYQQYLVSGPLGYLTDLFGARNLPDAAERAAMLYGAMFLFYGVYDGVGDKSAAVGAWEAYLKKLSDTWAPEGFSGVPQSKT